MDKQKQEAQLKQLIEQKNIVKDPVLKASIEIKIKALKEPFNK